MKVETRERIIRVIGELEGLAYYATGSVGAALCDVVETLDEILADDRDDAKGERNEQMY